MIADINRDFFLFCWGSDEWNNSTRVHKSFLLLLAQGVDSWLLKAERLESVAACISYEAVVATS